jgi:glutamine amidotransferase
VSAVAIVDYGAGNTRSVLRAFEAAGAEKVVLADTPEQLVAADRIVLPGVGAGGAAMAGLRKRALIEPLEEVVWKKGRPLLGICVGMQMMADRIYEFGEHQGLGWIAGDVVNIDNIVVSKDIRIPHMGWDRIVPRDEELILAGGDRQSDFYFAHSFAFRPASKDCVVATVDYGGDICVAVRRDNVFGVQFHPEKSQLNGRRLLTAFMKWSP